jgi:hypothetical protein
VRDVRDVRLRVRCEASSGSARPPCALVVASPPGWLGESIALDLRPCVDTHHHAPEAEAAREPSGLAACSSQRRPYLFDWIQSG